MIAFAQMRRAANPTKTHQVVFGCGPDPVNGLARKQGPWDNSTNFVAKKESDATNGGGSAADWDALRDLAENQVPYPAVDMYVINADGEIWRLLGLDASRPLEQKNNRRVLRYNRNSNPSCDW